MLLKINANCLLMTNLRFLWCMSLILPKMIFFCTARIHFGIFVFLIYINDLSNDIKSKCKLFADDTSSFSEVYDIDTSTNDLNCYLEKISEWAFPWKMKLNPHHTKQAQEIIFSIKFFFVFTQLSVLITLQ